MEFTTDEQEAVAVTTAIQEEIFSEMKVGMLFLLKYACNCLFWSIRALFFILLICVIMKLFCIYSTQLLIATAEYLIFHFIKSARLSDHASVLKIHLSMCS